MSTRLFASYEPRIPNNRSGYDPHSPIYRFVSHLYFQSFLLEYAIYFNLFNPTFYHLTINPRESRSCMPLHKYLGAQSFWEI